MTVFRIDAETSARQGTTNLGSSTPTRTEAEASGSFGRQKILSWFGEGGVGHPANFWRFISRKLLQKPILMTWKTLKDQSP